MRTEEGSDQQAWDHEQGSDDDEMLTYEQTAKLLNWRLTTLYSKVSRREIPHIRIGRRFVRFSRRALRRWLADRAVQPNVPKSANAGSRFASSGHR